LRWCWILIEHAKLCLDLVELGLLSRFTRLFDEELAVIDFVTLGAQASFTGPNGLGLAVA
jgi:hypothetical protein